MDVLNLLQAEIDTISCLMGVVLFLIFMTSSRLYVLAICCVGLLGVSGSARAFEIKLDKVTPTNVLISGFITGRVYQVVCFDNLFDSNCPKKIGFHGSTSDPSVCSFFPGFIRSSSVITNPAGWYNTDIFNPASTDLVWMAEHVVTNPVRVVGYYKAQDITEPFSDLSEQKDFCLGVSAGLCLFFCFGRVL